MRLLITLALTLTTVLCSAQLIQKDKQLHIAAGAGLGAAGAIMFPKNPVWGAVGLSTLVGTMKEVGDIYKVNPTGFDPKDLAFTVASGTITGIVIKKLRKKRK